MIFESGFRLLPTQLLSGCFHSLCLDSFVSVTLGGCRQRPSDNSWKGNILPAVNIAAWNAEWVRRPTRNREFVCSVSTLNAGCILLNISNLPFLHAKMMDVFFNALLAFSDFRLFFDHIYIYKLSVKISTQVKKEEEDVAPGLHTSRQVGRPS